MNKGQTMYKFTYSRIGRGNTYIEETVRGLKHEVQQRRDNLKRNWDLLGMISCSRIKSF